MSVFIAVKGIHVKNSGPKDLVISAPGGLNPTTLSYNQSGSFDVEGKYTGRYAGANFDAFSFNFSEGSLTVTKGSGSDPGASVAITANLT